MKSSRYFWLLSTIAFVLTWFVVIPYLASNPRIDLTAPVAAADHFTDNRGLTMTIDKASQEAWLPSTSLAARSQQSTHLRRSIRLIGSSCNACSNKAC